MTQRKNKRRYVYDSLGRLTSETHPESGTTAYSYDDNGNQLTKTDARNVTVTMTYDALNRMTARSFSDGTPSQTFSYDQTSSSLIGLITNGKGRPTSAWTSDGIGYSWSYDTVGRPLQEVASIDSTQYSVGYSYTTGGCGCAQKDLVSLTYPDSTTATYTRDSIGRVTAMASGSVQFVQSVAYGSQSGAMSSVQYGDGSPDTFSYDSYGRGLAGLNSYSPGTYPYVTWSYGYSASGRINQINEAQYTTEGSTTSTFAYGYDRQYRLSSAAKTSNSVTLWSDSWTYDRYDNMLSVDKLGTANDVTYSLDPSTNRLISSTASQDSTVYGFDAGGYLVTDTQKNYTYGGQSLLKEVRRSSDNAQLGTYRYDALGRRVKKSWNYSDGGIQRTGSIISDLLISHGKSDSSWKTE